MRTKSVFLLLFLFFSIIDRAQSVNGLKKQTLHGIVKNEKNKAVQNASVIVKGEEKGTVTDVLVFLK